MMKYLVSCIVSFLIGVQLVFAQADTSTFNIRVFGDTDTTPPSTPALLTAVPITVSQIDLAWSSSTDDFAVAGYNVFRNSVPIATTSLLSYSDTGLLASTTYTYTVRAFDSASNYSSSSNSLATTTLSVPVPSEVVPVKEGTVVRIVLDELSVTPGQATTSLTLATARPTRIEIRWGRSDAYELGYIVSNVYSREHDVLLTDLEPGTTYEYEVVGYTSFGLEAVLKAGTFTTEVIEQMVAPQNVARFTAMEEEDDVFLTWQLPPQDNIAQVRIVRSHLGFPEHPNDGAIVYQGLQGSVRDRGVLAQYSPVYYTAFVYDSRGNVSSGAIAIVYASAKSGAAPAEQAVQTPVALPLVEEATSSLVTERVTPEMKMPELSDLLLIQAGQPQTFMDPDLTVYSEQPFVLSLPKRTVAGNLKSIIATMLDPTDNRKSYSYLLRINRDRTAYEATVPAMRVYGASQIKIEIFDYEALVVATYQAPVTFTKLPAELVADEILFPDILFKQPQWLVPLLLLPILIFLIILFWRRTHPEDNK
jgi:hypothetical protein